MRFFLILLIIFTLMMFPLPTRAQTDYCGQPCFDIPFITNIPTPYNWNRLSCCHYGDSNLTCKKIGAEHYCVRYPGNQCQTKEQCCVSPTINPSITPTTIPSPLPTSTTNSWLDNDRSKIRNSAWFNQHQYSDSDDSFYPISLIDSFVNDKGLGPSNKDQEIVVDPPNLYYKHLTPAEITSVVTDWLLPLRQYQNLDWFDRLMQKLIGKVIQNPEKYANTSFDSLYINVEGGEYGRMVRSLTILVHPLVERPISEKITSLQRARNLYVPFVEGAVGFDVNDEDVHQLYLAALNKCGSSAIGGDQSGLGTKRQFGDYTAVVQWWTINQAGRYDDCSIHVVRNPLTPRPVKQKNNIIGSLIDFIKKLFGK